MDRVSASRKFRYVSRRDAALRLVFLGQFNMVIIVFFFGNWWPGIPDGPTFIFSYQTVHVRFPKWPSTDVSYKWYKATYQLNALIHISTLFLICQQFVKTWTWQKLFSGSQYVTRLTVRWKLYLKVLTSWKRSLPAWKNFQTNVSKKGNLKK